MSVKKIRYWIVNNEKPEAMSAVKKLIEGKRQGVDIIELSDLEYRWLHNQEACQLVVEEVE